MLQLDTPASLHLIKALADAIAISDRYSRAHAVGELVPHLRDALYVSSPFPESLQLPEYSFSPNELSYDVATARACGLFAILPHIPAAEKHALLAPILEIITKLPPSDRYPGLALVALAPHLPESLIPKAVAIASKVPEFFVGYFILAQLVALLPESEQKTSFNEALIANTPGGFLNSNEDNTGSYVAFLASIMAYLPNELLEKMLSAVVDRFQIRNDNNTNKKKNDDLEVSSAKIHDLETNKIINLTFEKNDEGKLKSTRNQSDKALLYELFDKQNVPEEERAALAERVHIEIARTTRPKWVGRLERGGELATLSAPLFLKSVHADEFAPDGTVSKEIIRAIDPVLMNAVEDYISKAMKRGTGLKDAEGLHFAVPRPKSKRARHVQKQPAA